MVDTPNHVRFASKLAPSSVPPLSHLQSPLPVECLCLRSVWCPQLDTCLAMSHTTSFPTASVCHLCAHAPTNLPHVCACVGTIASHAAHFPQFLACNLATPWATSPRAPTKSATVNIVRCPCPLATQNAHMGPRCVHARPSLRIPGPSRCATWPTASHFSPSPWIRPSRCGPLRCKCPTPMQPPCWPCPRNRHAYAVCCATHARVLLHGSVPRPAHVVFYRPHGWTWFMLLPLAPSCVLGPVLPLTTHAATLSQNKGLTVGDYRRMLALDQQFQGDILTDFFKRLLNK